MTLLFPPLTNAESGRWVLKTYIAYQLENPCVPFKTDSIFVAWQNSSTEVAVAYKTWNQPERKNK